MAKHKKQINYVITEKGLRWQRNAEKAVDYLLKLGLVVIAAQVAYQTIRLI
jgi:hypothetical protein